MLKPYHLLAQGFENNNTAQDKLFKHMCTFGSRAKWREGGIVVSYYLDVKTTKNQCCLLNPMPFECIAGYILEDAVADTDFNRLSCIRLNFIDGSISS